MGIWEGFVWGIVGAALIEVAELYALIHKTNGFPWKKRGQLKLAPYAVSVVIRLGMGSGLAALFAASGQVSGEFGAVAAGIAAPKIIQEIARRGLAHPLVEPAEPPLSGSAQIPSTPQASSINAQAQVIDSATQQGVLDAQ